MSYLEMRALAEALESWGAPTVSGMAGAGEIDVLVTGTMHGHTLVIDETVWFVRDLVTV